jgi:hypothetical protein
MRWRPGWHAAQEVGRGKWVVFLFVSSPAIPRSPRPSLHHDSLQIVAAVPADMRQAGIHSLEDDVLAKCLGLLPLTER